MKINGYPLFLFISLSVIISCTGKGDEIVTTPTITGISPLRGGINEIVTINGSGFNALADSSGCITVYFANRQVCGNKIDDNHIEVAVPFEAGDGPLCISFHASRICSSNLFDYIPGNPTSNSYMRLADCPNSPTNQVANMVATDNAILAGFLNWWKYDIDQNRWSPMTAPPDKLTRCATFTFNGKAYLFGGVNASFSNRLQCYDPATQSWSFKTAMPSTPRADAVAFIYNNKVYIAGGADTYALGMNTVARQLWQYDPVNDSWQRKADLPQGSIEGSYALRLGDRFYFPGFGYGAQEYNPITDSWQQFWPTEDLLPYAAIIADRDFPLGYILGGRSGMYESGEVSRVSIDATGNHFFGQTYSLAPGGGYQTVSSPFYVVVNNELYYGMGYFDAPPGGLHVQSSQFWRYRY
jgi:hypothetical protein